MVKWFLLLAVGCLRVLSASKIQGKSCREAEDKCRNKDLSCDIAYFSFKSYCPHVVDFSSTATTTDHKNCSKDCVAAIERLKQTKAGSDLHNCDCEHDGECLTMKARVAKCLADNNDTPKKIGCTLARENCSRNANCKKMLGHLLHACNDMISGVRCEEKCLKAQSKLFESQRGKALFNCECDGIFEPYCRGLLANAKQLRCLPGQDGTGTPNFEYENTDIIHGEEEIKNGSCVPVNLHLWSWTLLLALFIFL